MALPGVQAACMRPTTSEGSLHGGQASIAGASSQRPRSCASHDDGASILTIGRALQAVARWKGDAPCLTLAGLEAGVEQISFREVDERSNRLARAYFFFGARRNDLVTIALPTGSEFVVSCFACWKLGATPNNLSRGLTFDEREEIVRLARPKLVVGVPSVREPSAPLHRGVRCIPEGFQPGPLLSAGPLPDRFANSWLVASSGASTGRPKLIVLAEASFVRMRDLGGKRPAMVDGFASRGGGVADGINLVPSPLSHSAPFQCAVHGVLSASEQVLLSKFDAELMLRMIQDRHCTFCYLVPAIMKRVWDLPADVRRSYDMSSLKGVFHMAAPCPPWLKAAWCQWLGPERVWECYGPAEAMAATVMRGDEWLRMKKVPGLNLVGRPTYGELRVLDPETKEVLPPGTMGEVWMRHHERRITYYCRGAESRAGNGGWETVGDMGMLDERGFLHLGARKKDAVLIAGTSVFPAEVEAVLEEHPTVRSAVVVGHDDDQRSTLHAVVHTGCESTSAEDWQSSKSCSSAALRARL